MKKEAISTVFQIAICTILTATEFTSAAPSVSYSAIFSDSKTIYTISGKEIAEFKSIEFRFTYPFQTSLVEMTSLSSPIVSLSLGAKIDSIQKSFSVKLTSSTTTKVNQTQAVLLKLQVPGALTNHIQLSKIILINSNNVQSEIPYTPLSNRKTPHFQHVQHTINSPKIVELTGKKTQMSNCSRLLLSNDKIIRLRNYHIR